MNKILRAAFCILKNATIIIPFIEGVVQSINNLVNYRKGETTDVPVNKKDIL
jgi:hypothetical protein